MIAVDEIIPEQLAQARGCKPGNVCWQVCTELAAADLLDPKKKVSKNQLAWINNQFWT